MDIEDRISDLPDIIIQHIISLLPSTEEAIRTGILSKRWQNLWTCVPVLIFDSKKTPSEEYLKYFLRLIDNALHLYHCFKIKRLQLGYRFWEDPDFASKLRFAIGRNVEELILNCYYPDSIDCYRLPKFLIDNSSLVELRMRNCCFSVDWSINWRSLKTLVIDGWRSPGRPTIGKLISACPKLEWLQLWNCNKDGMNGDDDVVASKTLKRMLLYNIEIYYHMKILCPNLVELDMLTYHSSSGMRDIMIEISCPNLKKVELYGSNFKLVNCPSLVNANLDFDIDAYEGDGENVAMKNLEQLRNVKELRVRSWFIKALSALEMEGVSYPFLNNKYLYLIEANFEHLPGIACALRSSPVLERLVIDHSSMISKARISADLPDLNDSEENYWNSIRSDFNCLVSHLKFVKIYWLVKLDGKRVMDFIEFILKNARVLEKLVVVIWEDKTPDYHFRYKVSHKLLSFPRCSPHAIVQLS